MNLKTFIFIDFTIYIIFNKLVYLVNYKTLFIQKEKLIEIKNISYKFTCNIIIYLS